MDVFAHGFWGGALFCSQGRKKFFAAVLVGMAPDLISFGPFFLLHPDWLVLRMTGQISGPPALSILPSYVFQAYNITHSLVVCACSFLLIWGLLRRPPWLLLAWVLHIVFDIPTHTTRYFPTPFLWPFPTPFVNGVSWATPAFMAVNYACLITVYAVIFFFLHRGPIKH
ncbi:MAG TPA: hypothetical protein VLX11_00555 [Candidatus Acidoferrales bacterium]|nr:hypothetical protein [Candidatus Acidoferrales bacterium]